MILDLERILFVFSTIIGLVFWLIGFYISLIIKWDWNNHTFDKTDKCVEKILKDYRWDLNNNDTTKDIVNGLEDVPLIQFLMIGSITIGSVLLLNSLFSLNDMLILIPGLNKVFLGLLFIIIILVIVYLFKFIEFLNELNNSVSSSPFLNTTVENVPTSNQCSDLGKITINISSVQKHLNVSIGLISGIVVGIFILIVAPTVMAQTGRNKK